jgi:hypothetical protein
LLPLLVTHACEVILRDPAKMLIPDALSEYSEFHAPTIIGCVAAPIAMVTIALFIGSHAGLERLKGRNGQWTRIAMLKFSRKYCAPPFIVTRPLPARPTGC